MANKTENPHTTLRRAHRDKKDEFYTALADIESELGHYRASFGGKTVLCNCDDPYESNFFRYFATHFNFLGLKKLIATCRGVPGPDAEKRVRRAYKAVVTAVGDGGGADPADVEYLMRDDRNSLTQLAGDGDFRSEECAALLKEADIVVTNPPFSLFREYVKQLFDHGKKFLIIGNQNAVTYKEVFPLIKNDLMWFGPSIRSGDREFRIPDDYPLNAATCCERDGKRYIRVKGVRWFTNLDHRGHHTPLPLYKRYTPEEYPKYDNYDAIEVRATALIPGDYDGLMGVPITFLDKYCPEQFEIVGMAKRGAGDPALRTKVYTREEHPNYSDLNAGPTLLENGVPHNTYSRLLIRRKGRPGNGRSAG